MNASRPHATNPLRVSLVSFHGYAPALVANGSSLKTRPGSIYAKLGLNGGEWLLIQPVNKLSDSPEEDYHLTIDRPSPGEQVIAVRVTDEYDNQTVDKVVVR